MLLLKKSSNPPELLQVFKFSRVCLVKGPNCNSPAGYECGQNYYDYSKDILKFEGERMSYCVIESRQICGRKTDTV